MHQTQEFCFSACFFLGVSAGVSAGFHYGLSTGFRGFSLRFAWLFPDLSLKGCGTTPGSDGHPVAAACSSVLTSATYIFQRAGQGDRRMEPSSGSPDRAITRTFVETFEVILKAEAIPLQRVE
jgi:hypothetical protein